MVNKKHIIIALLIVILVLIIGIGFSLFSQSNIEYEKINISNGTTIDVPKINDASWTKDSNGIRTYTSPSKHVVMTTFNSAEDFTLVGAAGFAMARDMLLAGSKDVEVYNNYQIKENTINNTHFYIVNISSDVTHDNIIIGSADLNILKHMLDSLVLGSPAKVANNDTSDNEVVYVSNNNNKSADDKNKYSEEDLRKASEESYNSGYSDGIDSMTIYDSDSSNVETTGDSGSSDIAATTDSGSISSGDDTG